jgi:hypothetical protein
MCRIFFKQHTEREHMCPHREHMWLCTHCQKSFSARGTHVFMFSHSTATGSSLSIFTRRGSDAECCPKPLARGARSLNRHPRNPLVRESSLDISNTRINEHIVPCKDGDTYYMHGDNIVD